MVCLPIEMNWRIDLKTIEKTLGHKPSMQTVFALLSISVHKYADKPTQSIFDPCCGEIDSSINNDSIHVGS